ncbi:MAG: PepSY domain-containing protein [Croceibacterium sp.]
MRQRGDALRHLVRYLHLWLGLVAGALFALLGLTGSALVFYPQIDRMLHPAIAVEGQAVPGGPEWNRALETLRTAYPDKAGPWRLEVTGTAEAIPARYYSPPERAGHAFRPMMVWLAPDGGAVLRRDYWGEYAMTFVYDLHYRLLLGQVGGQIVGWSGFAMLALLLSGLWAWWPRGSWAKALRIKPRAHAARALRDWHKLSGLSGLLLLLILTVTGIMLALPEESDTALGAVGLPVAPMVQVPQPAGQPPATLPTSQAVRAALAALPGARVAWIETPPVSGGAYRLRMQVPGDPSFRFPHSYVWVDGASGQVLAVDTMALAGAGSTVNAWLHPLHDGSAGGMAGRVLAALAGLVPALLFGTGLARWRLRRRGARP